MTCNVRVAALAVACGMLILVTGCEGGEAAAELVSPEEALALMAQRSGDDSFVILDVRTTAEFDDDHIEGAVNIDYRGAAFWDEIEALDKTKTYLVYCGSAVRSGYATDGMKDRNFEDLYDLEGGITALRVYESSASG